MQESPQALPVEQTLQHELACSSSDGEQEPKHKNIVSAI